jgi:hypothetical protein
MAGVHGGGGGGGGGAVATQEEGVTVVAVSTALNFVGTGVTVTDAGSGVSQITIPGTAVGEVPSTYLRANADGTQVSTVSTGIPVRFPNIVEDGAGLLTVAPYNQIIIPSVLNNKVIIIQVNFGTTSVSANLSVVLQRSTNGGGSWNDIAWPGTEFNGTAASYFGRHELTHVIRVNTGDRFRVLSVATGSSPTIDAGVTWITVSSLEGAVSSTNSITVRDEGAILTTGLTQLNFVGPGVTATEPVDNEIVVTIPGGLGVQDEGAVILANTPMLNFVGLGVSVSDVSGVATISIPGGGAGLTALSYRTVSSSENLTAADFGGNRLIIVDTGSNVTLTIPTGLSPTHSCTILRKGTGEVELAPSGTVLLSENSERRIFGRYNAATVFPTGVSEEYALVGKLKV